MNFEPLYCDNHVAVFNKPAGFTTQIQNDPENSLEFHAKNWIKNRYQKPGNVFLEPIHRLDKPVKGLVVFARTSKALSRLQKAMREKQIKKTYTATVHGILEKKSATLEHHILHASHRAKILAHATQQTKIASLDYKVLSESENSSVLEIRLHTGRYHQIRAQLATIGHSIIGDEKYGSEISKHYISLIHTKIQFPHPVKSEVVFVSLANKYLT